MFACAAFHSLVIQGAAPHLDVKVDMYAHFDMPLTHAWFDVFERRACVRACTPFAVVVLWVFVSLYVVGLE